MKTFLKVTLGVMLGGMLLIGGCAALIGGAANEVQKESDKTAISAAQYGSTMVGTSTRSELEAEFGSPQSAQDMETSGVSGIPDSEFKQSCIYYNREGAFASIYQLCFNGAGVLDSKASY